MEEVINQYGYKKILGAGTHGPIHLVRKINEHKFYALKEINKNQIMNYDWINEVFRERDIYQLLKDNHYIL